MSVPSLGFSRRRHEIRISNERNSNDDVWYWFVEEPDTIINYSGVLAELVAIDKISSPPKHTTRVTPKRGVSKDALKTIISSIPTDSDDPPHVLQVELSDLDYGLDKLFELAIGCWQYKCCISPKWDEFSLEVKGEWLRMFNEDGFYDRIHRHPIDWMFIAIVFEWEDIFRMIYERVILNYGKPSHDNMEELPEEFISLVNDMRNLETEKAYNCIRNFWIGMWVPNNMSSPSMDEVHLYFDTELDIDLRSAMPRDLYQNTDPSSLLEPFETIFDYTNEQTSNIPPSSQNSHHRSQSAEVKTIVGGGRGGDGLFEAFGSSGRDIRQVAKKILPWKRSSKEDTLHTPPLSEEGRVRQSSVDARTLRAENLKRIPLRYAEFLTLQRQHIRRPAITQQRTDEQLLSQQVSSRELPNGQSSKGDLPIRLHNRLFPDLQPSNGEPSNGQTSLMRYSNEQGPKGEPSNRPYSNRKALNRKPVNGEATKTLYQLQKAQVVKGSPAWPSSKY